MRYWKWETLISLLVLSLIFNILNAQNIDEKPFKLFSKSEKIEIDQYGFAYHINKDNLIKFDSKGVPLYNYSNKLLGNITQLDISNPLRPLLFYKDQGIILALDNTLSLQKSEISLNELALYQTSCISNSNFDNGIWLYDIDVNEIIKINYQAEVVFKSGNLSVILPNMQFPVLKLIEKNKKLYGVTSNQIIVLDQYGSLLNTINIKATNGLVIKEECLIGYDGNYIIKYNYLDYKIDTIYQTNIYNKIIQCQEGIIGIFKGNSEANSIFISK
tara:strand:+ start:838 stop:1656 length:819 start_codon:yes stop_codon:yes gene_type:complete